MSLQTRMRTMALSRAKTSVADKADAEDCKRKARRKATALPAMLTFPNLRLTVPCTVADMSAGGARLSFPAEIQRQFGEMEHLPRLCSVVLRADRVAINSEILWRRGGKVGVRFLSPPKPLAKDKD